MEEGIPQNIMKSEIIEETMILEIVEEDDFFHKLIKFKLNYNYNLNGFLIIILGSGICLVRS